MIEHWQREHDKNLTYLYQNSDYRCKSARKKKTTPTIQSPEHWKIKLVALFKIYSYSRANYFRIIHSNFGGCVNTSKIIWNHKQTYAVYIMYTFIYVFVFVKKVHTHNYKHNLLLKRRDWRERVDWVKRKETKKQYNFNMSWMNELKCHYYYYLCAIVPHRWLYRKQEFNGLSEFNKFTRKQNE